MFCRSHTSAARLRRLLERERTPVRRGPPRRPNPLRASARQNIKPIARATALLRSFGLLREPIQRALLAAALRQLSARRRGSCASTAVFADMRSSVACHGHEMADNKKNMTPE